MLTLDVQRNEEFNLNSQMNFDTGDVGLSTDVTVVNKPDGSEPYDLTDKTIEFRCTGVDGTIDGGKADNIDAANGKFTFTWPDAIYYHSFSTFDAVFMIKNSDGTVVDTTSRFGVEVKATPGIVEVVGKSTIDGIGESLDMLKTTVSNAQAAAKTQNDSATAAIAKIGPDTAAATKSATDAATNANAAADNANKGAATVDASTKAANDAATNANTAAGKANASATAADKAAGDATAATKTATDAATGANTAAKTASDSAGKADQAASGANTAADSANKAAQNINDAEGIKTIQSPDGTAWTAKDRVVTAPDTLVTTNTNQTIQGVKTFANGLGFLVPASYDLNNVKTSGQYFVAAHPCTHDPFNGGSTSFYLVVYASDAQHVIQHVVHATNGQQYWRALDTDAGSAWTAWDLQPSQTAINDQLSKSGKVQGGITADGKALTIDSNGNLLIPTTSTGAAAPTITVGKVTSGTTPAVTNSGTASAMVLDFTLVPGPKGDPGTAGGKGDPGAAATIKVGKVTTGATASVTNSGSASAAVLDFVLQAGPKGDKGDPGATGPAPAAADIQKAIGVAGFVPKADEATAKAATDGKVYLVQ